MPSNPALRLSHVRFFTSDFGRSFRFWRDSVGLQLNWGTEEGPYADFDGGTALLAIYDREAMAEVTGLSVGRRSSSDDVLVNFNVADVDEAVRVLEERHVDFVTRPTDRPRWRIRTAHFRDPDGNLFEIYTDLPGGAE